MTCLKEIYFLITDINVSQSTIPAIFTKYLKLTKYIFTKNIKYKRISSRNYENKEI